MGEEHKQKYSMVMRRRDGKERMVKKETRLKIEDILW